MGIVCILVHSSEFARDRKSTRLNSSHVSIYTLSLHDALPISDGKHYWTKDGNSFEQLIWWHQVKSGRAAKISRAATGNRHDSRRMSVRGSVPSAAWASFASWFIRPNLPEIGRAHV